MANKRKTTTAIVAGVTAVALLLGGTFAWTSISQQAKNESAGIVNVGGRLHDDFNGTNKDVYVENFTDPLNGGQPIYARVRLDEYMEVGKEAGQADNADRDAVPVVDGTDINDVKTWIPHKPAASCEVCETEGTCAIHDHWKWEMGGQTTFMPTFNKDKDSLAADINGTYHGTDETDKIYYDDYVVYTTDSANGGNNIAEADKETYDGDIYSVVGTEYYDDDTDTEDNGGTRQVADVTHTAKLTADGTVMTMTEWLANPVPGNFWVYDTDGWAYWANPIMPGEATGLLLSNINMFKNPGEKCYYAINVVGQFATVNDWEYFYNENNEFDGTQDALTLLETASKNVTTVTVTNLDGITTVDEGDTVRFSASVSTSAETATLAESDFEWSVLDADHNVSTTSNITENEDGTATLTVGAGETSTELIIVARSNSHNGAVGFNAVALKPEYTVTVSATNDAKTVAVGGWLQFSAVVTKNGTEDNKSGVIWEVAGGGEGTAIDKTGRLTVSVDETSDITLTVTAISKADDAVNDTYTVTVYDEYQNLKNAGLGEKVTVDNTEWWVIAKQDDRALIWSVNPTVQDRPFNNSSNQWSGSELQTWLNGEYLDTLPVLSRYATEKKIYTASHHDRSGTYIETNDKVFLLSEADVNGTANGVSTDVVEEYTMGDGELYLTDEIKSFTGSTYYWLRSPHTSTSYLALFFNGGITFDTYGAQWPDVRAAVWVDISK